MAPGLARLPADATGHEAAVAAFVRAHLPRVRGLLAAALALNAAALLLAGVLAALARADDDRRAARSACTHLHECTAAVSKLALLTRAASHLRRSDDEEDGLASPRAARRRITLSGESRLSLGGGGLPSERTERLLPPPDAHGGVASYTQRMCVMLRHLRVRWLRSASFDTGACLRARRRERYAGETPPQRGSPARPRRLTPEALAHAASSQREGAACALM